MMNADPATCPHLRVEVSTWLHDAAYIRFACPDCGTHVEMLKRLDELVGDGAMEARVARAFGEMVRPGWERLVEEGKRLGRPPRPEA
jgi:predicted RNA-binding Zn-ribbon protein involved in translation (DUF1610 family)